MSDKLAEVMTGPLAAIENITINKTLDASNFPLEVCTRLLSTHTQSDWRILNPIRAKQAELINALLVENTTNELLARRTKRICPSEITSGMFISQHGYIGEVVSVDRYEQDNKVEPFCYCVRMVYTCGDLDMHKYLISAINNGTAKGYLSVSQGNRIADFQRVIEEGE